jgi:hypothetical protein
MVPRQAVSVVPGSAGDIEKCDGDVRATARGQGVEFIRGPGLPWSPSLFWDFESVWFQSDIIKKGILGLGRASKENPPEGGSAD